MAEIVQPWPVTGRGATQTDPARELVEGSADIAHVQGSAPLSHKQGGAGAPGKELVTTRHVLGEHFSGRGMDRYDARLAELGAADRQQSLLEIDILELQADRLTNAQAGNAQQPEQTVIGPGAQATDRSQAQSALEQALDLLVRVEVGSCSARMKRQQSRGQNLGIRIARGVVARKATHIG